ncbi:MAG: fibronectin type III domain-containing protein [Clostridium sp.]|nr:fibronectin type III domain-containing protein [Clostridium sp.]
MKKTRATIALLFAAAAFSAGARHQISSFREVVTTEGAAVTIDGKEQTHPDIYYVARGDGTFEAVRLTVHPAGLSETTLPYLNMKSSSSVCVNWKTSSKPGTAIVRYGSSETGLDKTVEATTSVLKNGFYYWNTAKIADLEPNIEYFYRVESGDNVSDVYCFRTLPEAGSRDVVRVLMIGDHQRNEHSDYEWLLNCARQTVAEKYGEGPMERHIDFVMNVGDQVDTGRLSLYDTVHIYKSRTVAPTLSVMTAVGNHEYFGGDNNLDCYKGHFAGYGDIEYQGIRSGSAEYYAYQAGRVLFVVMNSNSQGQSDAQKSWIRKVIAAASSDATVDFIVTVQHHPLYAEQWCHDVSSWMNIQIMPILCSTPKHVLNCAGHHHLYARGQMTNSPVYHMITGGGVGTSAKDYEQLWSPQTPDPMNLAEVQKTIDQWTYQILEFDPEAKTMTVETYSVGNVRLALDNELIDTYSRTINDQTSPVTPEVAAPAEAVELPWLFEQTNAEEYPCAVQYQVSRTEDFSELLINRIVTAEDCFGVTDDFRPNDLNRDLDITKMSVEAGTVLSNGDYFFRVRNRNANLVWSAFSEPVGFTVKNSLVGSLSLERKFCRTNSPMTVTFSGARTGTRDWVGIYEYGVNPGGPASLEFTYTDDCPDGTVTYTFSRPGTYFAGLFINDGYEEIAPRQYFVVGNEIDESLPTYIDTEQLVCNVGDPVVVRLHNVPAVSRDWVGLYDSSIPDNTADAKSHSYAYSDGDANGTVALNVAGNYNYTTPVPDGHYVIAYCMQDGYYEPMGRSSLVVGKPVMIEADRESCNSGETVTIIYVNAPGWETDSVRVCDLSGEIVAQLRAGQAEGYLSLSGLEAGEYFFSMTTAGGKEISPRGFFSVMHTTAAERVETAPFAVSVSGRHVEIVSADELRRVSVYGVNGSLVASPTVAGNTASFDLNLPAGAYVLTVDDKSQTITVR